MRIHTILATAAITAAHTFIDPSFAVAQVLAPDAPTPPPSPLENDAPDAAPRAPDTVGAPPPAAPLGKGFKGFQISSDDGDNSLRIGGLVQADGRFFLDGAGIDTLVVRRARLDLRATLSKYFDFRLQPDISGSKLTLLDAYGTVGFIDEFELQVGKMKAPIGLEHLQSPRDTAFPELGLPSLLVPNRDVGAVLQGEVLDGTISYAGGVFNGAANGATGEEDENNEKDYVGRLFIRPFTPLGVDALAGLGAGVSGSYGEEDGALPSLRSPGRQTFFFFAETATSSGERTRVSPQGHYYYGPLGVLAEYVRSKEHVTDGVTTRGVTAAAWQVVGSLVLFGGKAGYKGTKVESPLDPAAGSWGALELSGRYGDLDIEDDAYDGGLAAPDLAARGARSAGVAASYWLANGTRAHVAFDRTTYGGGATGGDRAAESVLISRLQVAL